MRPLVRVVTSAESAAGDAATIDAGVPSRALMQRAGAAAAPSVGRRKTHPGARVRPRVGVATRGASAAGEAARVAAGVPPRALMQRGGAAAAAEIALRFRVPLARGAAVFAGPGNNGGD